MGIEVFLKQCSWRLHGMEYLLQLDMLDMESLKDMLDKEYLQT